MQYTSQLTNDSNGAGEQTREIRADRKRQLGSHDREDVRRTASRVLVHEEGSRNRQPSGIWMVSLAGERVAPKRHGAGEREKA